MILSNLNEQEYKFKNFSCTEQCNGICMNGYISSFEVVDGYVKKINELFKNKNYLIIQKADFIEYPNYAFKEMRAYKTYKEQENLNSIRLNKIINNESFDDCICESHGYETYDYKINERTLKKIYVDVNGCFFCYHTDSSSYIKMNSLNLSWLSKDFFEFISEIYKNGYCKFKQNKDKLNKFHLLDISFLIEDRNSLKSRLNILITNPVKQYLKAIVKRFSY